MPDNFEYRLTELESYKKDLQPMLDKAKALLAVVEDNKKSIQELNVMEDSLKRIEKHLERDNKSKEANTRQNRQLLVGLGFVMLSTVAGIVIALVKS